VRLVVDASLDFEGHPYSVKALGGKATITCEVANIAKNLIGSGGLSLSGGIALYPAIGNLAYSVILSQTFQPLLETIGIHMSRVQVLLTITVVAILPLCL